ncbi:hypothetical protein Tco_0142774, partial [Tanacetum coccineum]
MSSTTSAVTYASVYTDSDEEPMRRSPEDPQTPPVPQDEDEREPMLLRSSHYLLLIHLLLSHPGYVTKSDPEEDPEEYEDDETEDGPVDYPFGPVDYPRVDKYNLLRGGCSDSGISYLWSIGGGMYRDGGSGCSGSDDDDDGDSSGDDANGEDEDDEDEEEEEEHLASTDHAIVVPVDELVFPPE